MDSNVEKIKSRLKWLIGLAILSIFVPYLGGVIVTIMLFNTKKLFIAAGNEADEIKAEADRMKAEATQVRAEATAAAEQIMKDGEATAAQYMENVKASAVRYEERLKAENNELKNNIVKLKTELKELTKEIIIESAAFSDLDNITSEEIKNKLVLLQNKEKDLLSTKYKDQFVVDDSGNSKAITNNVKQIIRCFNSECEYLMSTINYKNIDVVRSKINKSYEVLNKIFAVDGVELPAQLLSFKLEEARLIYAFQEKKEQERQQQQEIKAQMIEEEKVRREIEREKAKIEKEEKQFKGEVDKLMQYLQKAQNDVERNLYTDKIRELEEKIKLLEKDKENVLEREQNTRAGFVYVISNIGSFGEDVYKIGMTRRLEPMDRIKELGSASVPFEFDVHAMIFSVDAPALENVLHKTFRDKEVNKVNQRKEFFKVDLKEVERVVKQYHNATVTFTMIAEAKQYRESLRIAQEGK